LSDRITSTRAHLGEILVLGIPAMLAQASQPILNIGEWGDKDEKHYEKNEL
jgi:hypothetical protein